MSKLFLRAKKAVVLGGSGELGRPLIKHFRAGGFRKRWDVFNIDLHENEDANENFLIDPSQPITQKTID